MNIRPLEARLRLCTLIVLRRAAEWPELLRTGIQQISFSMPPSATVAIPSDFATVLPKTDSRKPQGSIRRRSRARRRLTRTRSNWPWISQSCSRRRRRPTCAPPRAALSHEPSDRWRHPTIQLASIDPNAMSQTSMSQASVAAPAVIQISLPAHIAVLPPPAPGVPPLSPASACISTASSARGRTLPRPTRSISKRATSPTWPGRGRAGRASTACSPASIRRTSAASIYQNADRHLACQFTFACDGKRKTINERGAWARANRIAEETLDGKLYVQAVGTVDPLQRALCASELGARDEKLARYGVHCSIARSPGATAPTSRCGRRSR